MKKIIILMLSFVISVYSFSISRLKGETVMDKENKYEICEVSVFKFDSEQEKNEKILREKKYLMEKDDFTYELIPGKREGYSDGVMYKGDYHTPFGYMTSWKGFYKNKYVSVYGSYNNFDEIKAIFFKEMEGIGYKPNK